MTPEEKERFFALRKKGNTGKGLTGPEDRELADLYYKRTSAILSMIPLPTCCEAATKYPAVTFQVDFQDPDEDAEFDEEKPPFTGKGRWYVILSDTFKQERAAQYEDYYRTPHPEPKFCPYCGAGLPKMVLKDPVPETVCRVLDGGYYCSTCRDRLNECVCDPPSSAFEPVP